MEDDSDVVSESKGDGAPSKRIPDGFCVECEDQPASVLCLVCEDDFCDVCFQALHRKGSRRRHGSKPIELHASLAAAAKQLAEEKVAATLAAAQAAAVSRKRPSEDSGGVETGDVSEEDTEPEGSVEVSGVTATEVVSAAPGATATAVSTSFGSSLLSKLGFASTPRPADDLEATSFLERSKFIPLRLSFEERKFLRLVESTLNVSEYTDKVDILSAASKHRRILDQIRDICAILSGLLLAHDFRAGQKLIAAKEFKDYAEFFRSVFEIARRHKVMNPEKMRTEYGKLIYMLQDSAEPQISELLEFECVAPVRTVYALLESKGGLALLSDPLMDTATHEILPHGKSRHQIQREIKEKNAAQEKLARTYSRPGLSPDDIKHCLYSINDNNSYLTQSRDPVDTMIEYLKRYFRPDSSEKGYSLAIAFGQEGARLSHDHERQYHYVLQSLMLWREIAHDMFRLWFFAEQDLLSPSNPYRLRDTGQGLNRLQAAPHVGSAMRHILHKAQSKTGFWVGSSVVHLGDHNVPNALMFIDKYTQVPRILNPIVVVLRALDLTSDMMKNPDTVKFVNEAFGGPEAARKLILSDFFRHAFDGSGADNFFDAGSCIDGRLTSAWNWCSKIEKKRYFPLFLLSGFIGFDGSFQK